MIEDTDDECREALYLTPLLFRLSHGQNDATVFVHLHAHAQIAAHPPLSSKSMHSELGLFHVIFAFYDMVVMQDVE